MIESEIVAHRYRTHRQGMRLFACEPAGLPIYTVTVDVLMQVRKKITPLDEFVLRAIASGIGQVEEIAQFLGVAQGIVESVATGLYIRDALDLPLGEGGERVLRLAPAGEEMVMTLTEDAPQEAEVWFNFDRLLWRPTPLLTRELVKEKEGKDLDLLEIRPRNARRPTNDDFTVAEVNAAVKASIGIQDAESDILIVKRVVKCNRKLQICHALIYGDASGGSAIEIAIDGHIRPEFSLAIEGLGGADYLKISLESVARQSEIESVVLRDVISEVTSLEAQDDEFRDIAERARIGDEDNFAEEGEDDGQTEGTFESMRSARGPLTVRSMDTYENGIYLQKAVERAKDRFLVISPWIKGGVVNNRFIDKLHAMARRGVVCHIGYGITPDADASHRNRIEDLNNWASKFPNVVVGCVGNTHAKILICDGEWVNGSFNWLSFRGDQGRTYRQEICTLIPSGQKAVDEQYVIFKAQIEDAAGKVASHTRE